MARPIRETPILFGKDAKRFTQEMKRVERMSKEQHILFTIGVSFGVLAAFSVLSLCFGTVIS